MNGKTYSFNLNLAYILHYGDHSHKGYRTLLSLQDMLWPLRLHRLEPVTFIVFFLDVILGVLKD